MLIKVSEFFWNVRIAGFNLFLQMINKRRVHEMSVIKSSIYQVL
jgi:hypothetical protein